MTRRNAVWIFCCAMALPSLASAAGPEALAAGARGGFGFRMPGGGDAAALPAAGNVGDGSPIQLMRAQPAGASVSAAGRQEVAAFDLAALQDSHWKTATAELNPTLSGKTVHVSGTFDRAQNAYLSVLVDGGSVPLFFELKGLLDNPGTVPVGSAKYTLNLAANPVKPLKSLIVFENQANEDDTVSIKVGKLLDGIAAAGKPVQLSDQAYRLFYYRDVKAQGGQVVLDPATKSFAMIFSEGEEMGVFIIPAEEVPSDRIAVFKMQANKRVGLMQKDGKLKIYENP